MSEKYENFMMKWTADPSIIAFKWKFKNAYTKCEKSSRIYVFYISECSKTHEVSVALLPNKLNKLLKWYMFSKEVKVRVASKRETIPHLQLTLKKLKSGKFDLVNVERLPITSSLDETVGIAKSIMSLGDVNWDAL